MKDGRELDDIGPVSEESDRGEVAREGAEHHRRERDDGAGKDHGHDASIVDLEREVGALPTVDLAADHALGVLDRNLADGLVERDHRSSHDEEENGHTDGLLQSVLGGTAADRAAAEGDGDERA